MRVLIIGASGRTGQMVVNEALERGHKVTALVRKPESMTARPGLNFVQGTPEKKEDVNRALEATGSDIPQAVIVTLNAPRESDSPFAKPIVGPRFMADSNANVRAAMKEHNVKKIVIMGAFGAGDSFSNLNFLMRPVISCSNMSYQFKDHDMVDTETKASGLDWVIARPAMLKGEEALPIKRLGNTGEGGSFMPSISRASVAKFLVDAVESERWNGTTPVICN